ncbi:proton-translocating NADH-quinone oxidoreductase chain L [Akkermansia muciniphila CAG:154]|nr:proton-translocating NADH-quinone oxidoreductase chain L [Akkermansia muciniphila CAG:154]
MFNIDIQYTWLLLFLPLVVAAFDWFLLTKRPDVAALTSTFSCLATFVLSLGLLDRTGSDSFSWLPISDIFSVDLGFVLDPLSSRMMLVVTGIGLLVHVFSLAYMADDKAKTRYFACLSLFMFSMTGIVLANNIAMTFIFWELVGLSSYLLIGHWYTRDTAANAAKKAFICNRVGDFGFLIGILTLWALTNTLDFSLMEIPAGISENLLKITENLLNITVLCLFCGAVGKSAQFPLHVWLPDAMEGPTPVSALIHAATMVAAGVYMMVRVQYSIGIEAFPALACNVIAGIGAITAVIAAFMATQQNDIKRVLAYSTLSQLGYMVMALGLLAGEAAMFHLFTHAWFKALLFLGAGAIIFACHHEQDIWKMGGIMKRMKLTSLTFIIATMALIAIPFTSGFFSKEAILEAALRKNPVFFWIGAGVALLTTFYMMRVIFVVFFGKSRSHSSEHASEVGGLMLVPLLILAVLALISGYGFIADRLVPFNGFVSESFHMGMPFYVSMGALVLGILLAAAFYAGSPASDKLSGNAVSRALANRLYIDLFYDKVLVRGVQGVLAAIIDFMDQFIISGLIVGGLARLTAAIGSLLRRLQSGNMAAYTALFGIGLLLVIYFTVFYSC